MQIIVCISCKEKLSIQETFTGMFNYNEGQYLKLLYCDNKACDRFGLFTKAYEWIEE